MNIQTEQRQYEFGPQPLDTILAEHDLANKDVVQASTEHITFKMVQKGRKGRRLTRRVQLKILTAVNSLLPDDQQAKLRDLFTY